MPDDDDVLLPALTTHCSGRVGSIAWDTYGEGPGVPLLALHGLTDSGECWTPLMGALARGRTVLTVDARGHGGSELPEEPFTIAALAADAAAVVREVLGRPVVALGHSMGGVVAEELALSFPELVVGLVLEDPAWLAHHDADDAGVPSWLGESIDAFAGRSQREVEAWSRAQNAAWPQDEHASWAASKLQVSARLAAVPHEWDSRDWVAEVAQVQVPVTLLTGEPLLGSIVDDEMVERASAGLGPLLTHVAVAGVGHNVRREGRASFLAAVERALALGDRSPAPGEPSA